MAKSEMLLNTKEAAQFLRVSEASIRRWSDLGLLPSHRVGRRRERRFSPADLREFLGKSGGQAQPAAAELTSVNVGGASVPIRSHIAPIYGTDAGGLRLSVPFLAEGIRAGQPCFLEAAGAVVDRYARALAEEHGIDFSAATESGKVAVFPGPGANTAEAIGNWEQSWGRALAGGPTVIRVVGEMACVRSLFASEADLFAYEEAYEVMARRYPAVTLCQYDAREFDGEIILRVLKAHPDMFQLHIGSFLN